jgi:dipeptidyl aminopeptidase/acylaminoacyl peptidase
MPIKQLKINIEDLNKIRHFNDVKFSRNGVDLFWQESIDGKGVIFQTQKGSQPKPVSGDFDVRGTVGYGGGGFDTGQSKLVFSDRGGGLHQLKPGQGNVIETITSTPGNKAAPALSPNEDWVVYVYQQDEVDGLAVVHASSSSKTQKLTSSADFYMQPTWHPSGKMIAWAEWDHPYMPWDASCIKIGKISGNLPQLQEEFLVGGAAGAAASQPRFSPDGKWLSFIRRDGNWDNLILYDLLEENKRTLIKGDGFHLCLPNWVQGMRSYTWSNDSHLIYYFRYAQGRTTLWQVDLRSGKSVEIDIQPVSWATQIDSPTASPGLAFLGVTASQPKQIWQIQDNQLDIAVHNELPKEIESSLSKPQAITFQPDGQHDIYGIYFPPASPPAEDGAPPLILDIHSGPTSQDTLSFSTTAAYFTSRSYAYAQINYRGSSGYGYWYQEALKHNWSIVDVEDTLNFAQELIRRGLAHPDKLVLKGSSAGGFTALNTLIRKPGLFRAAICSYAVCDLVDDARNTHKFERYYHRFLTGDLEKDHQRFLDRSPIFHIEGILDPVALFHGDSDKVVSPSQSVEIFEGLSRRGVPVALKIYEGEGHGFRKIATLKDYYQRIEDFLQEHLG